MHIAVVSNTAWYLFNFRLNLMLALKAAGHTVVAMAGADVYAERIRAAGIAFEAVPISGSGVNPVREAWSVWRLRLLLKRQAAELVLSYTTKGNLYTGLACRSLGLPFVPNVSGLGRLFIRRSPATQVAQAIYRLTFRHAPHVFFQNAEDLSVFLRAALVQRAQAERLPGSGVDLKRFQPVPLADRPLDAPVFLLVARMLWDKGVGEYIAAARAIRAQIPGATFRLLGAADSSNPSAIARRQIDAWVREGVVSYTGPTDDVRPHLADADCVVLPSYREGVPRVLLEAAAMARPVITSAAPGCRDAVLHGRTGFMCAAREVPDLAVQMRRFVALSAEERLAMGQAGRSFMEANFSEQLVINRYLATVAVVAAGMRGGIGATAGARPGAVVQGASDAPALDAPSSRR